MRNLVVSVLFLASPLIAAEPRVQRDMAYVEPKTERQTLDLYAPASGTGHPVVVWIHGGGWRQGDKRGVQQKPEAFVEKGFVFVSTNYRFVPQVTVKEMTSDVAKAIRETKAGKVEFRVDKAGIVHCPIGKIQFDGPKLAENAHALIGAVLKAKPAAAKGKYVKKITLTSTMGPGITIDLDEAETHAAAA